MLDQTEDKGSGAEAPADDLDAPEFKPELETLMVDSDRFMAHRAPVDIKPDQPELPIEDGADVPDPVPASEGED